MVRIRASETGGLGRNYTPVCTLLRQSSGGQGLWTFWGCLVSFVELLCWSFLQILSQILFSPGMTQASSLTRARRLHLHLCTFVSSASGNIAIASLSGLPSSHLHLLRSIVHIAARICLSRSSPDDQIPNEN